MRTELPHEIAERWQPGVVLKRDIFSTVERGKFSTPGGVVDAVLRRVDQVPWWSRPIARHLLWREQRALQAAGSIDGCARLLMAGRNALVRSWIDGAALHLHPPVGDAAYFRSAKGLLRKLHHAGVCHNDLAKRQNWLRGRDGRPYLTDFQLAIVFRRQGKAFRLAAYEDLRHLLKHKRSFAPDLLTPTERRVLARKSLIASGWLATGKHVYLMITRGFLGFADREGAGPRLVYDAPRLAALFKTHPQVRDVVIVSYPDQRAGIGLYAFVESAPGLSEQDLRKLVVRNKAPQPPEHVQLVDALPRHESGSIHTEILQLVASNQLDLIEPLLSGENERQTIARIVAQRQNLRDRTFN